jgi:hypothetical protein
MSFHQYFRGRLMSNTVIDEILQKLPGTTTLSQLAQVAGIHYMALWQMKSGARQVTARSLGQLRLALSRIKSRQLGGEAAHNALFRSLLVIAANEMGVDPVMAQNSAPSKRHTGSVEWRNAAFARWIARYLMNVTLGFSMADVGRAEGVTKAAVSSSMPEIELRRDDPEFDAMLARLELQLLGRV